MDTTCWHALLSTNGAILRCVHTAIVIDESLFSKLGVVQVARLQGWLVRLTVSRMASGLCGMRLNAGYGTAPISILFLTSRHHVFQTPTLFIVALDVCFTLFWRQNANYALKHDTIVFFFLAQQNTQRLVPCGGVPRELCSCAATAIPAKTTWATADLSLQELSKKRHSKRAEVSLELVPLYSIFVISVAIFLRS